jgi:tRNA(Arg) A34 adenosine deaminase TadA
MKQTPQERFMREAIRLAKEGMQNHSGGPFGAVIVKNGEIIGSGQNQVTSLNDPTAHAEIQAIRNACKNLNGFELSDCEIYSSSEPCPMCFAAIYWSHLKKIYFGAKVEDAAAIGFDDVYIYQEITKPINNRGLKSQQLLRDEILTLFHQWQQMDDKIRY